MKTANATEAVTILAWNQTQNSACFGLKVQNDTIEDDEEEEEEEEAY